MTERRAILNGSPAFWFMLKFVLAGPALRLLFRPKVTGLEHIPAAGGAIVAANHVSYLDSLLLALVIPGRRVIFLTKAKYIDKPLLHPILVGAGVIPVAGDSPAATAAAVAAAAAAAREGRLVGIFPEGTRSPDGRLHRGRTGVARIAFASGVPVIPAGITGTDLALPRGKKLPRPRPVRISFGPPILLAAPGSAGEIAAASRSATGQVMTAIAALSGQQVVPGSEPAA